MIKLGIFGDQTSNPNLLRMINNLPGVTIAGVYFSGNIPFSSGFREFISPVELMWISDAILIISEASISSDLIRLIMRKSKHLYLKAIPQLNLKDIKELTDLEKEAGLVNYIYNPFDFIPHFDALAKRNEKPLLINLRTCFEDSTLTPGNELLLLVTALNRIIQSKNKKTDVFGLIDTMNQLVVNINLGYENSSVVNLTVTRKITSGNCEIFSPSGSTKFEFEKPLFNAFPDINQEYTAINNFIQIIQASDKTVNSFDNLQNGVRMVEEIIEHLRFNDIKF